MRKLEFISRAYIQPKCNVVDMNAEFSLLESSTSGGHNDAGDEEPLGAKQGDLFNEDELKDEGNLQWN